MTDQKDSRTQEQLREHYEIEKDLASRLRKATSEERQHLYSALYDELYRRVSHHPRNTRRLSSTDNDRVVRGQMLFLRRFLRPESVFLEVGPGDCGLSFEVAKSVRKVYAVDVSAVATRNASCPDNVAIMTFDGINVPLPGESVDIAYSHQVMEHLHQDDAEAQLRSIYDALAPGGKYVCLTPNRLYGPSDISMYFDETPTGFHMKEYTNTDLSRLMLRSGFAKVKAYAGLKGRFAPAPNFVMASVEAVLGRLPHASRRAIAQFRPVANVLGIRLVATK
ncbi:MAG: class I SAM-dependent methyltransferase [Paludisphaera borealis]|uniref:class I SAM-dependent methyltransferase n=1 Tax=Paludisphaera borealis TaxID=1387353 RepID=UPI00284D9DE5|nr:class I SAM-dependent methyltransferase [Paludisphaera borealis]MDR3622504.1 class I SAM-dependent methyltransferase [Paludisphaera borealis]